MPNRAERRAAERLSHKQNRAHMTNQSNQTPTAAAPAPEPVLAPIPEPTSTASEAQIRANQQNAQSSTGPTSPSGKARSAMNSFKHGLNGEFVISPYENYAELDALSRSIYEEYQPQTDTEIRLANLICQHYWLMQRAMKLQRQVLGEQEWAKDADPKKLTLFLRYQTTHERSYYKAQRELKAVIKERQKQEIGSVSQNQKQEAHEARVRLATAKAERLEIDTECQKSMEAPLPGHTRIPLDVIAKACTTAISMLVFQNQYRTEENQFADAA